eukprot:CAMPEP_0174260428 /NCGR_PEP_ID=MMETSP0439-20130205/9705_1 /TAXON_ID=0 /ORGANISM="Stereomyxa ramosa, Strain Chinc5" /LENGTH=471 /DNA_ID=CAMNT_0015344675 /DNA_START=28 /DNA_END=1443 /DNA_ORIENTATION=+
MKVFGRRGVSLCSTQRCFTSQRFYCLSRPKEGVPKHTGAAKTPTIKEDLIDGKLIRIASVDSQEPLSTLTLVVEAGPRHELPQTRGAATFAKLMAYTRSATRSPVSVTRHMENTTASFSSYCTREHIIYSATMLRSNLETVVSYFEDMMTPVCHEYIINDLKPIVEAECQKAEKDRVGKLIDLLHCEAYRNTGLGTTVYCPEYARKRITDRELQYHFVHRYIPEKLCLVATGVEHSQFRPMAEKFSDFAGEIRLLANEDFVEAPYKGGDGRVEAPGSTLMGVAFEGARDSSPEKATFDVLASLLGSGSRGPKVRPADRQSRLGQVLEGSEEEILRLEALNFNYLESGLWGVWGEAQQGSVPALAEALSKGLKTLTKGTEIPSEELEAAKKKAKRRFLEQVSSSAGVGKHIANALMNGGVLDPLEYAKQIDSVSSKGVADLAKRVVSSELTYACFGDVEGSPTKQEFRNLMA